MQRLALSLMKIFLVTLSLIVIAPFARAGTDADEIIKKANAAYYYGGRDGRARVTMTIKDASGAARTRELTMLRYDVEDGGEQKYYVYFHRPLDVEGMIFMVWKKIGADDDRWLYVPAIDLVRRVAASNKRSSFAGSHFTYEDVSGRHHTADAHELLREEKVGERDAYVIRNTPKDADIVEFSRYTVWIDKETFLPLKAEYLDRAGKPYKVMTTDEIRTIQGIPTVVKATAEDLGLGTTTVEFGEIRYDVGLTEDVFTERYLRKPPRKWVR